MGLQSKSGHVYSAAWDATHGGCGCSFRKWVLLPSAILAITLCWRTTEGLEVHLEDDEKSVMAL